MGEFRRARLAAAVAVACATVAGVVVGVPSTAVAKPIAAPADFNGDGFQDLVVPAPNATVGGKEGAGAVAVLYGSRNGVSAARKAVFTQNTPGVPDAAEAWDYFGSSTAFADLDKDGYSDLVVGAPAEDVGRVRDAGSVTVLWGGRRGLSGALALPVPASETGRLGQDVAAVRDAGGPRVLVAGYAGSIEFSGTFRRDGRDIRRTSYLKFVTDGLGVADYGDFNGDKVAERVLTSHRGEGGSGGSVHIDPVRGSRNPLPTDGTTTAVGDVNGDGFQDLVVGDPDEPVAGTPGHRGGQITVWYGSRTGLAKKPAVVHQDTAGVPGASARDNGFGTAVAIGDLNRDGAGDIVVGVPGQAFKRQLNAGAVVVVPGRKSGALGAGAYQLSQETASVPGDSGLNDSFGHTLAVGDVRADGRPDVIVGGGGEDDHRGGQWLLPGAVNGRPTGLGSVLITTKFLGMGYFDSPAVGGWRSL
ncbi:hypothetical protein [Streptomyces sp. NPDC050504]|uniref:hypothetical protein n=1 Tax=Streptomyces sp. NPDC050504 TaxID=3365618 RepID=UPI00379E7F5E